MKVYLEGGPLNGIEADGENPSRWVEIPMLVVDPTGGFKVIYYRTGRTHAGLRVYVWEST